MLRERHRNRGVPILRESLRDGCRWPAETWVDPFHEEEGVELDFGYLDDLTICEEWALV